MSVREKRLTNDFQALSELANHSSNKLTIISTKGQPPYQYVIEYNCVGVEKLESNLPIFRDRHRVEITLGNNYPSQKPDAKFLTQIFHPNVYKNLSICLGGNWTITETLSELILRIGKIIQYAEDITNLKSPANTAAKHWAVNNLSQFPLDTQTFISETNIKIAWREI
jgi:ubiquitin-protein ligase